jgi:predicted nucleotidyltransferase
MMMDLPGDWLRNLRAWASANNHVREFWLFGSRADGHAKPESDVDLAIALMPDALGNYNDALGNYFALGDGWQRELEAIVGRHVSLEAILPDTDEDACVRSTGVLLWSDAARQTVIRCAAADVRDMFERWLDAEAAAGVRLVILEGAMRSGKSSLTKQPFTLSDGRGATIVEVDDFIHDANPDEGYLDAVKRVPLMDAIKAALAASSVVIVEGAIVWPLQAAIVTEIASDQVRLVYLKRMKWSDPDRWHDANQLLHADTPPRYATEFSNSIDRYHRDHQPWREADLVLERIEADGEDDQ